MTEKYIDLAEAVGENIDTADYGILTGIEWTLEWLDEHPFQVPGRTITESELKGVNEWLPDTAQIGPIERRDVAEFFGITVVPDPEPTNAEKLAAQIRLTLRENSPGTCKNEQDMVAERIAADLDEAGVKAPGGDE